MLFLAIPVRGFSRVRHCDSYTKSCSSTSAISLRTFLIELYKRYKLSLILQVLVPDKLCSARVLILLVMTEPTRNAVTRRLGLIEWIYKALPAPGWRTRVHRKHHQSTCWDLQFYWRPRCSHQDSWPHQSHAQRMRSKRPIMFRADGFKKAVRPRTRCSHFRSA